MKQLNSHNFEQVYKWLGINLNKLGCVMLDVEAEDLSISHWLAQDGVSAYYMTLPLYTSKNPERFWIKGFVMDKAHVTVLYGLLQKAEHYRPHIEKVLKNWKLDTVEIESFGFFESPYPDEPYYCIVAHVKVTDKLLEGHRRLEFLPHINTFAGYKPHMTVAYIEKNEAWRDAFIEDLTREFVGKKLKVKGINYGGTK